MWKFWLKQVATKCFPCHRVEETLNAFQHKTTEQSLCEERASGVEICDAYSSSQNSRRSQFASYGNYVTTATCFHYSRKYKMSLCLEYDCNAVFLQALAASEFLRLIEWELRTAHAGRPSLHPVVSNSFHKHVDLVRHAVGHTQLYYILLKLTKLTFQSLLVMWCNNQFNIQQLYALPTLYLCVLYLSENKQRLVPLTA